MKIRQATEEDAYGIAMVTVESWQSTYKGIVEDKVLRGMTIEDKTKRWKRKIGDGSILFVVEDEGLIIGYVHAGKKGQDQADMIVSCTRSIYWISINDKVLDNR